MFEDGKLIFRFMKAPLTGSSHNEPRDPRLKPLTPQQLYALSVVDKIAFKHAIGVPMRTGDMIFINNLALLHARNRYSDGGDARLKRHLTRVIVRDNTNGWKIPEILHEQWRECYNHDTAWEVLDPVPTRPQPNVPRGHG